LRVISGKYKGKKLQGFDIDGTRPTMDRVKESLFGMIQNDISDSTCLDLFAGSGALGIEALSMGAKACYFTDHNDMAIKVLKENTNNVEDAYIIKTDYKKYLNELEKTKTRGLTTFYFNDKNNKDIQEYEGKQYRIKTKGVKKR